MTPDRYSTAADPTILRAYIGVYGDENDHKELIACAPCIKTVNDVELKKLKGQKRRNTKWLESSPMSVSTPDGGTRGTAIVVGRQREFDFSRGKAVVKLRICCNCKHLGERAFRCACSPSTIAFLDLSKQSPSYLG